MRKTFAILLASTALAAGAAIPAGSAMQRDTLPETSRDQAAGASGTRANMMLASDDDGVERDHGARIRRGGDDDRHAEGDDEDDDDDDAYGSSTSAEPTPAGAVAPPANGLFGSGAIPKVKVN